jgi:hypothetical protein
VEGVAFQAVFAPEKDTGSVTSEKEVAAPSGQKRGRRRGGRNRSKETAPQKPPDDPLTDFEDIDANVSTNTLGNLDTAEPTSQSVEKLQKQEPYASSSAKKALDARDEELNEQMLRDPGGININVGGVERGDGTYMSYEELDSWHDFFMQLKQRQEAEGQSIGAERGAALESPSISLAKLAKASIDEIKKKAAEAQTKDAD